MTAIRMDEGTTRPRRRRPGVMQDPERLARGLGWFSLGLGLAQVMAPRRMARLIGVDEDGNALTMRAIGVRELAAGVGILSRRRPAGWVWSRVAGDVMDLALLGRGFTSPWNSRGRLALATTAVAAVTALDILAGQELGDLDEAEEDLLDPREQPKRVHVTRAVTVRRSPEELFRFWRDFENLPRFMHHLESVEVLDGGRSRWRAKAPAGKTVEWEAELVGEEEDELIVWRSLPGSQVPNAGSVVFRPAPGDQGTEVVVELTYDPPGGQLGRLVAKMFGQEPAQQLAGDMRRFKQVMELGEEVRSDASIHEGMHPARPPEQAVPLPERAPDMEGVHA